MTNGWTRKAKEVQHYTDTNDSHQFFTSIKYVYDLLKSGSAPSLSAEGSTLIKDKACINNRWKDHFSILLNHPPSVKKSALDQIPQKPMFKKLDDPPSMNGVRNVTKQIKYGKAADKDGIPAELFKALSEESSKAFHEVLASI